MATHVQARFIDERLAFIGGERKLGCIFWIEMRDHAADKAVWKVEERNTSRKCGGKDSHFFGAHYQDLKTVVTAGKLRLGAIYEVHGVATGSNSFSGAFRITRDDLYRIEDVDPDSLPMIEARREYAPVEGPDEQTLVLP